MTSKITRKLEIKTLKSSSMTYTMSGRMFVSLKIVLMIKMHMKEGIQSLSPELISVKPPQEKIAVILSASL